MAQGTNITTPTDSNSTTTNTTDPLLPATLPADIEVPKENTVPSLFSDPFYKVVGADYFRVGAILVSVISA